MELDLVITWVDGQDPAWLAQFQRVSSELNFTVAPREFNDRFDPVDDLSIALDTLDTFAAGVFRKVWIVHDPIQKPKISRDYISLVSHEEIIPAEDLPLFNSYAIEPYLHRISGLSEHFVYANDDCFFKKPVSAETFFEGEKPKMFAACPVPSLAELEEFPRLHVAWQFTMARTNSLLNSFFSPGQDPDRYLRISPAHVHMPLTKTICQEAWEIFHEPLSLQSKFPIRCMAIETGNVVASTNMLFPWVGIELGRSVMRASPLDTLDFRP